MAAESPHEAVLDAVELVLQGLSLDGVEGRVYRRLALAEAYLANVTLPCLLLSGQGSEVPLGGTTGEYQGGYPVTVRVIARHPPDQPDYEARLLRYRRLIRDALHRKSLTITPAVGGLREVYALLFQSGPTVEPQAQEYQITSSPLVFQAGTFESAAGV